MYRKFHFKLSSTVLLALLFSTSCSANKQSDSEPSDPALLYEEGLKELSKSNYQDAVDKFQTLEKEHPASDYAAEAQIRRAYSYYRDGKFDMAVLVVDDFVKQYPTHKSVTYMYYLKGLSYFDQILDVGRDQLLTQKAIAAFDEVILRFPTSKYATDAKIKIEYCNNNLAGKEMEIGHLYLQQNQLIAALNRYKTVVDKYQTSIFIPEALYRMSAIYYTLGDLEQSQKYASVLGYNYSDSEWYKKAYALLTQNQQGEGPWYTQFKKIW